MKPKKHTVQITKFEACELKRYHTEKADHAAYLVRRQRKKPEQDYQITTEEYAEYRKYYRAQARYWRKKLVEMLDKEMRS